MIAAGLQVQYLLPQDGDDARTVAGLALAREMLARADALVTADLSDDGAPDEVAVTRLVGGWEGSTAAQLVALPAVDATVYRNLLDDPARQRLDDAMYLLDRMTVTQWRSVLDPVLAQLDQADQGHRAALADRLWPRELIVIGQLLLVVALGLVAVFASLSVSIATARRLRALRAAADDLAGRRLPDVVDRLGRGETVDVATEAPPLETGRDEIGQVSAAFNRMQATAVRVAIEQAELRQRRFVTCS